MNTMPASLLAAFLVGLGGSAHCALMCGGISASMVAGVPRQRAAAHAGFAQLGRIGSYAFAGTAVAVVSSGMLSFLAEDALRTATRLLMGLAWIGIAVQLLGGSGSSRWLAWISTGFWKRLQPLTRRVWPIDSPRRAFAAGALWGWLPCGMSYAMLLVAAATASPLQAAGLMLAFGVGTLPGTLLPLAATRWLQYRAITPRFRQIAAAVMLGLGAFTLAMPGVMHGHEHHMPAHAADPHAAHSHHPQH